MNTQETVSSLIFPLRFKLALLASSLLVAGIGTVSWIVLERSAAALEAEVKGRGIFLARHLADNARDPMLLQDELVLTQLLARVSGERNVLVARLLDTEGDVVASSSETEPEHRGRLTTPTDDMAVRSFGGKLLVASYMPFRDVDVGEAQVVMDIDAVLSPVVRRARRDVLLASGALLAIGVLIAFATSGAITRPLRRLREAVDALAAGDLSARLKPTSRDELAVVARAFNDMSESLSQKRRVETAFRRYVSDHVLREVLDAPERLELKGERREVSVIFIDIRQFTRLTSWIGPERLVAFLNETFDLITSRLLEHGATVDKYIGDAILAYFGAPIESEDHAQRAVAAAIAIQRSITERNHKLEGSNEPFVRLEVGIGIHTGPVVVGNIGSELKMDYTVIGEPVNIANRLQALAGPTEIMITSEVRHHLGDIVDVESLGLQKLDGVDEPIEVLRVGY